MRQALKMSAQADNLSKDSLAIEQDNDLAPGPIPDRTAEVDTGMESDQGAPPTDGNRDTPSLNDAFEALTVDYLQTARDNLLSRRTASRVGFRDSDGYIVDYHFEQGAWVPHTRGEGTLHTAIAGAAIAAGNFNQDGWEVAQANDTLRQLLSTLQQGSW